MRGVVHSAAIGRLPVRSESMFELRLLGPVELRRDGLLVDDADWRRARVRSLLSYLVLHGPVSRSRLADELWPRLDPVAQSRNLRVTLTYLLRVLEPGRGRRDASFFVRRHGVNLSLHVGDTMTIDVWEFDRHCAAAAEADRRDAGDDALRHALDAAALWRGDPAELTEPWAVLAVEHRRRRYAEVITRAGELLLARGDSATAIRLAERAVEQDPWIDAAHRLAVAAYHAKRDEVASRRALGRYQEAIRSVGFTPGEAACLVDGLIDSVR